MTVSKQQAYLNKVGLDAIIAGSPQNVTYTAQFKIPSHGVVVDRLAFSMVTRKKSYLIVYTPNDIVCKYLAPSNHPNRLRLFASVV